jgi:ERCC4-related helicase
MNPEQPNSNERPKVPLLSGLQNMILRIKNEATIEAGMVKKAIEDKKLTTRAELEALRDSLEMQIDEELEALKDTDFTEENDSLVQIIKDEIGAIDEALASGKFE